ncbi:hypothetical protein [Flavobacterium sp.]|uniref:hypothetical protein n=1 Tax=Flavobacterium sp. TaxID=239 RepID=UPI001B6DE377|nr:hypothetical protein [Flavobacterium sp.]MBP6126698.1 hypothetical protein [Flavobacterium sp.]
MFDTIITEDISTKTTFFYPCSGMDVQSIIQLLDEEINLNIENFILVDLNMDYDMIQNNLELTGYFGLEREFSFFDNKLGLYGIRIIDKIQYDLDEIEKFIGDELKEYKTISRFNDLVGMVVEPKAIRYQLTYNSHEFTLYLIHYEATVISEKISLIKNLCFGLILVHHVNGAYLDDFFMSKMESLKPLFLFSQQNPDRFFTNYKMVNNNMNLYSKDPLLAIKTLRVKNALKFI